MAGISSGSNYMSPDSLKPDLMAGMSPTVVINDTGTAEVIDHNTNPVVNHEDTTEGAVNPHVRLLGWTEAGDANAQLLSDPNPSAPKDMNKRTAQIAALSPSTKPKRQRTATAKALALQEEVNSRRRKSKSGNMSSPTRHESNQPSEGTGSPVLPCTSFSSDPLAHAKTKHQAIDFPPLEKALMTTAKLTGAALGLSINKAPQSFDRVPTVQYQGPCDFPYRSLSKSALAPIESQITTVPREPVSTIPDSSNQNPNSSIEQSSDSPILASTTLTLQKPISPGEGHPVGTILSNPEIDINVRNIPGSLLWVSTSRKSLLPNVTLTCDRSIPELPELVRNGVTQALYQKVLSNDENEIVLRLYHETLVYLIWRTKASRGPNAIFESQFKEYLEDEEASVEKKINFLTDNIATYCTDTRVVKYKTWVKTGRHRFNGIPVLVGHAEHWSPVLDEHKKLKEHTPKERNKFARGAANPRSKAFRSRVEPPTTDISGLTSFSPSDSDSVHAGLPTISDDCPGDMSGDRTAISYPLPPTAQIIVNLETKNARLLNTKASEPKVPSELSNFSTSDMASSDESVERNSPMPPTSFSSASDHILQAETKWSCVSSQHHSDSVVEEDMDPDEAKSRLKEIVSGNKEEFVGQFSKLFRRLGVASPFTAAQFKLSGLTIKCVARAFMKTFPQFGKSSGATSAQVEQFIATVLAQREHHSGASTQLGQTSATATYPPTNPVSTQQEMTVATICGHDFEKKQVLTSNTSKPMTWLDHGSPIDIVELVWHGMDPGTPMLKSTLTPDYLTTVASEQVRTAKPVIVVDYSDGVVVEQVTTPFNDVERTSANPVPLLAEVGSLHPEKAIESVKALDAANMLAPFITNKRPRKGNRVTIKDIFTGDSLHSLRLEWQRNSWRSTKSHKFVMDARHDRVKRQTLIRERQISKLEEKERRISSELVAIDTRYRKSNDDYRQTLSNLQGAVDIDWLQYRAVLRHQHAANEDLSRRQLKLVEDAITTVEEKARRKSDHERIEAANVDASVSPQPNKEIMRLDHDERELLGDLLPWARSVGRQSPLVHKRKKPARKRRNW